MKFIQKITIFVLLPLLLGGFIYVGFRPKSLIMFSWFESIGIDGVIDMYRNIVSNIKLPEFVIYSIPTGLYVFAILMYCRFVINNFFYQQIITFSIIFITIISEVFQDFFIPGTSCYFDIIVNFSFIWLFLHIRKTMIIKEMIKLQKKQDEIYKEAFKENVDWTQL